MCVCVSSFLLRPIIGARRSIAAIVRTVIKRANRLLTKHFSPEELQTTRITRTRRREAQRSIGSQPTKAAEFLKPSGQWQHVGLLKIHFESVGGDETTPPSRAKDKKYSYKYISLAAARVSVIQSTHPRRAERILERNKARTPSVRVKKSRVISSVIGEDP